MSGWFDVLHTAVSARSRLSAIADVPSGTTDAVIRARIEHTMVDFVERICQDVALALRRALDAQPEDAWGLVLLAWWGHGASDADLLAIMRQCSPAFRDALHESLQLLRDRVDSGPWLPAVPMAAHNVAHLLRALAEPGEIPLADCDALRQLSLAMPERVRRMRLSETCAGLLREVLGAPPPPQYADCPQALLPALDEGATAGQGVFALGGLLAPDFSGTVSRLCPSLSDASGGDGFLQALWGKVSSREA